MVLLQVMIVTALCAVLLWVIIIATSCMVPLQVMIASEPVIDLTNEDSSDDDEEL